MGIAYSDGRICDFAGPYFVNTSGHMVSRGGFVSGRGREGAGRWKGGERGGGVRLCAGEAPTQNCILTLPVTPSPSLTLHPPLTILPLQAFGAPTRHIPLHSLPAPYDASVLRANDAYKKRMHNICCDNCHSHVACALNDLGYGGHSKHNMVSLAVWVFFWGKFGGFGDVAKTFGPFSVLLVIFLVVTMRH